MVLVTRESVLALMPHNTLAKIIGEPTHKSIKKLEKELGSNLIAVPCPWGRNKGHLGILQDAPVFTQRNGGPFTPPLQPPPTYPDIPPAASTAQRERLRADNEEAQRAWATYQHVQRIAVNLAADAIEPVYYAELDDPDEGLNDVSIRDLIDHIRQRYCHIAQDDIDANMDKFNEGIDPTLPLAVYTRKQETCQEFAQDANVPISEETMVTTGTKHALQCGGLTQAWREWRRLPADQHTWLNWKSHWTAAFNEQRDISRLTGGTIMSQANAAVDDTQWSSQMITSLDNLANAAVQKNDTVERLVVANKQLTDTVTKLHEENAKLLNIIQHMAGQPPRPSPHQQAWSRLDPKGYCHSHGYRVTVGHNSKTCRYKKPGHQDEATRQNTMGGNQDNKGWQPK